MISNVERVIKKSMEDAEKQGMEKRNIEIARKMLSKGIDVDTIANCTGLSKEEVEKFQES